MNKQKTKQKKKLNNIRLNFYTAKNETRRTAFIIIFWPYCIIRRRCTVIMLTHAAVTGHTHIHFRRLLYTRTYIYLLFGTYTRLPQFTGVNYRAINGNQ